MTRRTTDPLRVRLERVAATGSELESAWLVPKIDREQQLGGPMARHRASLVALRAALATPSEPTLDAERLAEAMAVEDLALPPGNDRERTYWRTNADQLAQARRIADEYARLSETPR